MNPIHANAFDFLKNHFNIFSSTPSYSKRSPSFGFPHEMKYQTGVYERFGGPKSGKMQQFYYFFKKLTITKGNKQALSLSLHAMKAHKEGSGIAPVILDHGTTWKGGRGQPHSRLFHPPVEEPPVLAAVQTAVNVHHAARGSSVA
jgi:hypothetical protein